MSKFFRALERAERDRADRSPTEPSSEHPESAVEAVADGSPSTEATIARAATITSEPPESRTVHPPSPASTEPLADDGDEVEAHLVSLHAPTSFAAEQYRNLRHLIEDDGTLRVIAITSPSIGDGKTTTAVNLAGTLGQSPNSRVLLIDADLRMPKAAAYLGVPSPDQRVGLVDLLTDLRLPLEAAVTFRRAYNLWVMPAGDWSSNPYELLKSPRLEWVIREARERYDFVILDASPAVPLPDCRLLSRWVDGFIVIVTAHKTPRRLLQQTLETIETSKLVGLIYNRDQSSDSGYRFHYAPVHGRRRGRFARMLTRVGRPFGGPKAAVRKRPA